MMKTSIYLITFLMISLIIGKTAQAEEQVREVSAFSKISFQISGKVYVEQAEKQSVKIIAEPETLEEIVTEVKNGTLQIKFESNMHFGRWNPGKIEVYITVPKVDGLLLSGSGDIIAKSLVTQDMELKISGSGNIKVDKLTTDNVKAGISGSGNIAVSDGTCSNDVSISISGSGNVNASGLKSENVSIGISGSGNCTVQANSTLKVRASGSGNVYYSGNPNIDSSISGSGKLKKQ